MTPRAMCRIVMSALLLFGPLLTEWLSPAQVWGSALNTPSASAKAVSTSTNPGNELVKAASSATNPGTDSTPIANFPSTFCNYSTNNNSGFKQGIYGSIKSIVDVSNSILGAQAVLIDAVTNSPIATATVRTIGVGSGFQFPDTIGYTGPANIPETLKFKLYFIPPAGNPLLPQYYPKAVSLSGAATLAFNLNDLVNPDQNCAVIIDGSSPTQFVTTNSGQGIEALLYRPGAIAGQVYIRNSGFPITTGVPISNATVSVFTATTAAPNTPATPVITTATDINGNFMVDAYSGSTPLPDNSKVWLKFFNGVDYQDHWLSNYNSPYTPVDCDDPCNPSSLTGAQKLQLVNVVVFTSGSNYSQFYNPSDGSFPNYSPIIARMVANNKILGKITTDGTNGAVGSYAVAYVGSTPVQQSAPVDATGVYTISKISNYVTYTVKFVTPVGTPYVGEWWNNKRVATNTTANKLYTTIPGVAGNFNNVDAILTAGAGLSGKVTVNGSSTPIGSVQVSVYSIDALGKSSIISNTTTDSNGDYSFPGLLDFGNYKINFRDINAFYIAGWWNGGNPGDTVATEGAAFVLPISSLTPDQVANVALRPGNSIQGVITLNPAPPANFGSFPLRITVYDNTGTVVQDFNKVITENPVGSGLFDGSYSTAALDDGLYKIQFTPPASFQNIPGYLAGFYQNNGADNRVDTIAQADQISVQGTIVAPINITFQQGAGLNLRIFSRDDNNVLSGYNSVNVQVVANVGANPASPVYATQLSSGINPDGMVQFTNLPAGSVRVYIFPPGTGAPSYSLTDVNGNSITSILLTQGQYGGTTILGTGLVGYTHVVTRSAELIGSFSVTGGGVNLSTTQIKAYRTDTNNTEVPVVFISPPTLNPITGLYDFDAKVQAGTYRFKFIPPAPLLPQFYNDKYNFNSGNTGADTLQLFPDQKQLGVNVVFNQGGAFRIKVVDAATCDAAGNNCTPVQGAQLKIFTGTTATTPIITSQYSGDDLTSTGIVTGIVNHKPLAQGTNYYFQIDAGVTGKNYQTVWYSNKLFQSAANPIQTQNGVVTNLTIKIGLASRITGNVTRNGVSTGSGVQVTAYLLPLPAQLSQAVSYQTTTISDGSYKLDIPQGNYIVAFNNTQDPIGYYANATNPNFATTVAAAPLPGSTGNINYNFQSVLCGFSGYSIGAATTTSAQITYYTDCSGDTKVYYSLTPNFSNLSNVVSDGTPVNTHDVTIPNLQPNTTYYLKLTSIAQGSSVPITYTNEIAVRTAADGRVWYFASGSTISGAISSTVETLHLFNNDPATAVNVNIFYYYTNSSGTPVTVTRSTIVPANQRKDIDVGTDLGVQTEHSTVVSVTNSGTIPIMVERSIRTNRSTITSYPTNGGYTIPGATGLSFEWWFANVNVFPDTDNYFSIYNPNVITACYSVYYYRNKLAGSTDNAGPEAVTGKLVPPLSKVKFGVKDAGYTPTFSSSPTNLKQFSVRVLSSNSACPANGQVVPLVVEQETYYGSSVLNRKGVAGKTGIPARQPNWIFSDGLNRAVDSQLYVFTNPSSATVITLTYQLERPQPGFNNIVTYTLPANSRFSITVTNPNVSEIGRSYGFSVKIDAAKPVAVERYATYELQPQPNYDGLMSEPAFSRYSTRWQFAGGDTTRNSNGVNVSDLSYILTNPSLTQTVTVSFTYFFIGSSTPTVVTGVQVAPNTRMIIQANQVGGYNYGIGPDQVVAVQIDSSQQIAAERVYYWKYGSMIGGNAVFGYIPPNF